MFRKMLSSPPPPIIGLDVGSSTLKIARLAKSPDGFRILKLLVQPTPANTFKEDGRISDTKRVGEELKAMLAKAGLNAKQAVTAVGGASVVVRTIIMPCMTEKELQNSVKYEAERYLPYSLADAQIAGAILRSPMPGDEKNMEVLLMASPKDAVRDLEETLHAAGLSPQAIELEPVALLRLVRLVLAPDVLKQAVAVVNAGAAATTISIFKDAMMRNSRAISVAGNSLTRAVAAAMNSSFEEAEKLKIEKGLVRIEKDAEPVPPVTMRLFNIMLPSLTELATEIQRSFDFYRSRYRGESVDVVYLSGGTSKLKNLDRYLAGELGVHVEPLNPVPRRGKEGISGIGREEAEKLTPVIPACLGLAARNLG